MAMSISWTIESRRRVRGRAADRRQVDRLRAVDRDQRRPFGRDQELVHVGREAVAGANTCDLLVGRVDDHALALAGADVRDRPFPPGEHRAALVDLAAEVDRDVLRLLEPDEPPAVVEDHRTTLAGPGQRCHEQEAGLGLDRFRMLIVGTWNEGWVTNVATPAARSRAAESCGNASPSVVPAAAARNSRRVRFTEVESYGSAVDGLQSAPAYGRRSRA